MAQQVTGLQRGDRVELIAVPDDSDYQRSGLRAGECGTVDFTDSLGTIHVRWDTGRRVGIIAQEHDLIRRTGK
jgi:hypothetical protein